MLAHELKAINLFTSKDSDSPRSFRLLMKAKIIHHGAAVGESWGWKSESCLAERELALTLVGVP